MARVSTTKTVVDDIDNVSDATDNMNEEIKSTKKTIDVKSLDGSDEIEVISLVPNVSYKDSKTLDVYEWDKAGHIESMTFDTLNNMWRNNKGYFKNMWLKPNDDRVINKFGLTKTFKRYEYLMEASNYIRKNINDICDAIAETPNGLKFAICDKVKSLVISGEITDIQVIKTLENRLKIDLIEFI